MANSISLLQLHPMLSGLLAVVAVLAVVGFWYVIHHHLQAIVVILVCSAGAASGAVVFWRGVVYNLVDLISIGVFLMVIFPYFLLRAIRRERPAQVPPSPIPGLIRPASGSASTSRPR